MPETDWRDTTRRRISLRNHVKTNPKPTAASKIFPRFDLFRSAGKNEKMKKIMFGLAAAIAMVAAADIESSNIVGYQSNAIAAGYTMIAPSFVTVGGTNINIQDVKPEGDAVGGWGDVQIQILNAEGNTSAAYGWFTADMSGAEADGWCNDDMELVDIEIVPGQAFIVYSDNEAAIRTAGEVSLSTVDYAIVPGYTAVGNAKPVAKNIQTLSPVGDAVGGWGDVQIQVINSEGNTTAAYGWFTADMSGADADGWCNDDMELVDITINPGEGFIVYSDNDASIRIPGIEL